jgi:hypothetical protein
MDGGQVSAPHDIIPHNKAPQRADRLLIVATDFFNPTRTGEVAEWSKALPC